MENIQTKVPDSRRGKYVVIGLLAVICLLSFHVYREHKLKKDLVRRKAFLLGKLRDSRMSESKTTTKLERVTQGFEEKKQQLTAKGKEIEDWKNKLEEMTNSYNKGLQEVVSLKESATKSQDSLATLKKQYLNASSTIDIMKDKLERTLKICDSTKGETESLNKSIKDKEAELHDCTTEKDNLENEKQDLTEKLNKLKIKLTASQSQRVDNKPVNDNTNNRQDLGVVGEVADKRRQSKSRIGRAQSTESATTRVTTVPDVTSKVTDVTSQSGAPKKYRTGTETLPSESPTSPETEE